MLLFQNKSTIFNVEALRAFWDAEWTDGREENTHRWISQLLRADRSKHSVGNLLLFPLIWRRQDDSPS